MISDNTKKVFEKYSIDYNRIAATGFTGEGYREFVYRGELISEEDMPKLSRDVDMPLTIWREWPEEGREEILQALTNDFGKVRN